MNIWRYPGHFLLATAVIHCAFGVVVGGEILQEIGRDGILNTVYPPLWQRQAIFWFLMTGVAWGWLGWTWRERIRETGRPLPASHGWFLLAIAVGTTIVMPASGAWLFYPQAALILLAARRSEAPHE